MTPVLSRAQMRAFDAHAIGPSRVPGLVLMENAGRGATDVLVRELLAQDARGARVAVVCGTGNNGGDGFVVARHLLIRGAIPTVHLVGDAAKVESDARVNLDAWRGIGGAMREWPAGGSPGLFAEAVASADVVVDALFGTGLDRAIDGFFAEIVRSINAASGPRFALDLPSGLDADTGAALGVAVEARVTTTFALPKLGLLTPNGARLAGRLRVVDIGVPASFAEAVGKSADLLDDSDLAGWRGPRVPGTHKGAAGHVVVVAGSSGKIGAPQLVARGALRAGAGLVTIATWPDAAEKIEARVLEAMTARLDPAQIAKTLEEALRGKDAVAVGPGLGLGVEARAVVAQVIRTWQGPLVIDADALTLCADDPEEVRAAPRAILTPHPGEAARLLHRTTAEVEADRFRAVRDVAAATRAVVVLKGAHTLIASPDGRVAVSPVACPALAVAGSGDVLSGIVAAMSVALPAFDAACAGVLLHGRAGEAWSRQRLGADRGMLASEIADGVPTLHRRKAKERQ